MAVLVHMAGAYTRLARAILTPLTGTSTWTGLAILVQLVNAHKGAAVLVRGLYKRLQTRGDMFPPLPHTQAGQYLLNAQGCTRRVLIAASYLE